MSCFPLGRARRKDGSKHTEDPRFYRRTYSCVDYSVFPLAFPEETAFLIEHPCRSHSILSVFPVTPATPKDSAQNATLMGQSLSQHTRAYLAAFCSSHVFLVPSALYQTKKPSLSVQGPSGQENVDCVTAKEMVKQCDAKCLLGAHTPQTIVGEEVSTMYNYHV